MYSSKMFKARLVDENHIDVVVEKAYNSQGCQKFFLYDDEECLGELKIESVSTSGKKFIYQLSNPYSLKLGRNYVIFDERNIVINLDCSCLMRMDKYIDRMYSDQEMGAIYSKKGTTFRIFSPLASSGVVKIDNNIKNEHVSISLVKNEKTGVLEGFAKGDYANCKYSFLLKINNEYRDVLDPYAKAVTVLSKSAVIVNPKEVHVDLNEDKLQPFGTINDAIIYEVSVRDLTTDKSLKFKNKGKFLGFIEEGVKTEKGNPAGFDYLKSLGVTHVQLLPIYDFQTTNDLHPEDTYNWGYDPCNYNTPEGSFSTDPKNPLKRIVELKQLVSKLHANNMRVVMDVVYNHVFNMETSCFEQACPNYYFKFNQDGSKSDGSFCGNEFESRHLMARKYVIDSCLYWVKEYGIDGFRFDLMGLLDIDTINKIYVECRKIKPDIIIYGEGWDMPTVMGQNQRASMNNAHLMPNIGFFNDRFRDITKGKTGHEELQVRGYLTGDTNYMDGFKHVFSGSVLPIAHPPLFRTSSQSINYIECHDNNTIYDKLKACCPDEDEKTLLRRIKLNNAAVMFSYGVPFFHMGQEIGLTKFGDHNSYRSTDLVNQFRYSTLDERMELYNYFKDLVAMRKELAFLRVNDKETIEKSVKFNHDYSGILKINIVNKDLIAPYKDVIIFINPRKEAYSTDLNDYYKILFNESGKISSSLYAQHLVVNPLSLVICVKE